MDLDPRHNRETSGVVQSLWVVISVNLPVWAPVADLRVEERVSPSF